MSFVSSHVALLSLLVVGLGSGSLGCRRIDACPPGFREEVDENRCFRVAEKRDGSIAIDPEPSKDNRLPQSPITPAPDVPRGDAGGSPVPNAPADAGPATDGQVGPLLADAGERPPSDAGPAADAAADVGTDAGPSQPAPGGATWHPRETVSVVLGGPPDLIAAADGRVDVFWADGTLRRLTNSARPSRWGKVEDLGAPPGVTLRGAVDAVSWAPGRFDVFARGNDNRLWHVGFDGRGWFAWDNPGGASGLGSSPSVCSWASERLDIVWLTSEGNLGHIAYVDLQYGWSLVDALGAPAGGLDGEPRVASWGPDRLDIVARGRDQRLWHTYWDREWAGRWGNPGEVSGVGEGPDVISRGPGLLDFVWAGANLNALHVLSFNGSNWEAVTTVAAPPGVNVQQRPALSSWAPDRLDVFVAGDGNRLWHALYDGASWRWGSYFSDSDLLGAPTVQSAGVDKLAIAFPVQGNKLGYVSFF